MLVPVLLGVEENDRGESELTDHREGEHVDQLVRIEEPVEILAEPEEGLHVEHPLLELAVDPLVVGVPLLHLVLEEQVLLAQAPPMGRLRDIVLDLEMYLLEGERLLDVVLRAGAESAEHLVVDRVGRDHDDRDIPMDVARADVVAHLETVPAGQHDVEEHEIGPELVVDAQRRLAVGGRSDLVAPVPEGFRQDIDDIGIVVDDENADIHCRLLRSVRPPRRRTPTARSPFP